MSLYKREGSDVWYVNFRTPGGGRVRQTTGTDNRKEAQEYHDKLKAEHWRVHKLGERPRRTFGEAAIRFLAEHIGTVDYTNKAIHIRHFREAFSGRKLDEIGRDEILAALPDTSGTATKNPKALSVTTKNRYLGTMRTMFNAAVKEWGWLDAAPKLSEMKTGTKRIRWIARDEAIRLLQSMSTDWMRDVTIFGFATGLRQANILGLEWSQVDLVKRRAWIHPDQAKARKPIGVPLNPEAVSAIRRQLGRHDTYVFARKGKRGRWDRDQWLRTCARAGITNFRFHDVRHTWASWHVQGGTPLNRLMELGGWSKYEMVLRYAHLAPDHLAKHADAVTIWSQGVSGVADTLAQEEPRTLTA
jgi:integrase